MCRAVGPGGVAAQRVHDGHYPWNLGRVYVWLRFGKHGACAAQSGLAVSLRNVCTMGVIMAATALVSAQGAVALAAHEITRQIFIMSVQLFSALDVTAQSLVAAQLGQVRRAARPPVLAVL